MKEQELLFSIESALDIHPLENFKILFANLKANHLDSSYITGQTIYVDGGLTLYPDFRSPWSSGELINNFSIVNIR